jgi:biopolymer transport protein ExbB/TolQ
MPRIALDPSTLRARLSGVALVVSTALVAGSALGALVGPSRAFAAEEEAAAEAAKSSQSSGGLGVLADYLNDGGWMMYVILGLLILGTGLFLERAYDLYLLRRLAARSFMNRILDFVETRRYSAAIDACSLRTGHPLAKVVKAGVLRANRREKEIERAMEKEMLASLPGLQKRIGLMALLANTATLLGLLGTIFGLITAFESVAAASAAARQQALADGISQAMYTTAFGICVAVPLLFFHHFLSKRMESIILEIEGGASALLLALSGGRGRTQDDEPAPQGAPAGAFDLAGAPSRA